MRTIIITGPESSGKTTLALALAERYGVRCVQEQSRPYLDHRGGKYEEEDLLGIAEWQVRAEENVRMNDPSADFLICDTDLITIRIWSDEKYGRTDPWIIQETEVRAYDLWILCTPDMPWEPDPLRENPNDRDRLFNVYEQMLVHLGKPYIKVAGPHKARMQKVIKAIDALK